MRLTFVTTNAGKVAEMTLLLAPIGVEVVQDARGYPELQASTLDQVTEAGADHLLASGVRPPFILEDSGLFVAALRGFPGVYSRHALDTIGVPGLLRLMAGIAPKDRVASFNADILLVERDEAGLHRRHFAGACRGFVATAAAGGGGFGFDPVFRPLVPPGSQGDGRTFAEVPPTVKAALSHRGVAARALAAYLAASRNQTAKP
ncbi:MAG: non-canonical purine NTP pyrophosphatase [bacterium]